MISFTDTEPLLWTVWYSAVAGLIFFPFCKKAKCLLTIDNSFEVLVTRVKKIVKHSHTVKNIDAIIVQEENHNFSPWQVSIFTIFGLFLSNSGKYNFRKSNNQLNYFWVIKPLELTNLFFQRLIRTLFLLLSDHTGFCCQACHKLTHFLRDHFDFQLVFLLFESSDFQ